FHAKSSDLCFSEYGPEDDEVSSVRLGTEHLVDGVTGSADEGRSDSHLGELCTRFTRGQFIRTAGQVHAVESACNRNVDPAVDQQLRAASRDSVARSHRQSLEIAGRKVLLTQLDPVNACAAGRVDAFDDRVFAAKLRPVGDGVKEQRPVYGSVFAISGPSS